MRAWLGQVCTPGGPTPSLLLGSQKSERSVARGVLSPSGRAPSRSRSQVRHAPSTAGARTHSHTQQEGSVCMWGFGGSAHRHVFLAFISFPCCEQIYLHTHLSLTVNLKRCSQLMENSMSVTGRKCRSRAASSLSHTEVPTHPACVTTCTHTHTHEHEQACACLSPADINVCAFFMQKKPLLLSHMHKCLPVTPYIHTSPFWAVLDPVRNLPACREILSPLSPGQT